METLIDSLDETMWQSVDAANRGDGYKEFHVMRQHKLVSPGTMKYLIQEEDGDAFGVVIEGCKKDHDPLKDVGTCEMILDAQLQKVVAIDLDGDIAKRK
ncbi:uncharacterized protein LOC121373633 isoform X2 [Gigantopelta aegis]|nr:uncharacterized protein LOC121373633 isoform X2 [Gigantopelta aegis]